MCLKYVPPSDKICPFSCSDQKLPTLVTALLAAYWKSDHNLTTSKWKYKWNKYAKINWAINHYGSNLVLSGKKQEQSFKISFK